MVETGMAIYLASIGSSAGQFESIATSQDRPGHSRILGGDGDHGLPVTSALGQCTGPAADAVGLRLGGVEDGSGAEDEKTAEISVAGFGDASESGFTAGAVLSGHQAEPRAELSTALELVTVADHGNEGGGGGFADATQSHELLCTVIFAGHLGDVLVVIGNAFVEAMKFAEEITDDAVDPAREFVEQSSGPSADGGGLEREDDADFGEEAADTIDGGGALVDEPLTGAMDHESALLVNGFDGDEAHVGTLDGLADGGGIGGVVLAAFAGESVGGDELGGR